MPERAPRLKGKVAIVTGAGARGSVAGNGQATAVLFTREGANVVLVDHTSSRAERTLAMIRDEGGEACFVQADVTVAADCRRMVESAVERYGRVDILHNNVGIARIGSVVDMSEEDWDLVMTVNVKSMMLTSKFAIPKMITGGGGAIINVASSAGLRYHPGITAYSASKGGVIALTYAMAGEHARDKIRVNCIAPGLAYTSMVADSMDEETRTVRRLAGPLGTEGTAWDIAWTAVYLASDEARWVTGAVIPVDAGLTIATPGSYQPTNMYRRLSRQG